MIFKLLDIDTLEVLKHAKWNFTFSPRIGWRALIGVDPYYLTYKQECSVNPEITLAGRRTPMEWPPISHNKQ